MSEKTGIQSRAWTLVIEMHILCSQKVSVSGALVIGVAPSLKLSGISRNIMKCTALIYFLSYNRHTNAGKSYLWSLLCLNGKHS